MFLQLAHTKLDVFQSTKKLTLECYRITKQFPNEEKFCLVQQIRRAALSVHLNLSEGCSRKSEKERRRFFEIARGSLIEVDTAATVSFELGYVAKEDLQPLGDVIIKTFKLLSGMMR
jgi:four helix bundle protein